MGQLQGGFSIIFLTISSKTLVLELLRFLDLMEEQDVCVAGWEGMAALQAAGVCLFSVAGQTSVEDPRVWSVGPADSGAEADVSVVQDENKEGCVEAVLVERLESKRRGCGWGEHVGRGSVVADGRSEAKEVARGSSRQVVFEERGAGEGGGEGDAGREDVGGEYSDVG